jgi:hypothetical protein
MVTPLLFAHALGILSRVSTRAQLCLTAESAAHEPAYPALTMIDDRVINALSVVTVVSRKGQLREVGQVGARHEIAQYKCRTYHLAGLLR